MAQLTEKPVASVLKGLMPSYKFKLCVGHVAGITSASVNEQSDESSSVVSISGLGINLAPTELKNGAGGETVKVPTYPVRGPVTIVNALRVHDRHWRSELAKISGYSCSKDVTNYGGWIWIYLFDRFCNPVLVIELQHAWVEDYKINDLVAASKGFVLETVKVNFMNMVFHEI